MGAFSGDLQARIDEWLRWDKNERTLNAVKKAVEAKDVAKLEKVMLKRMTFGTAGLRGVMAEGFASMNDLVIIQTSQGLAKYVQKTIKDADKKGVVVSYDGRHNSSRFAALTAQAFLQLNIPVYLFSKLTPTPFVPFAILEYKAACGVMVTASHNPKDDNGYKVYWENGAQIISPDDKGIQQSIEQNLDPWTDAWKVDTIRNNSLCSDPWQNVNTKYFQILKDHMHDLKMNSACRTKFTFTAMHGVSHEYITTAAKQCGFADFYPVQEQMIPDPDFPTVKFPNPEEGKSALDLSFATANKNDCRVILANDPDADRLAVAERIGDTKEFRVFSGDNFGALLGWWMFFTYKEKCPNADMKSLLMIASTVSSKILRSIANKEGFNFEETLTGFKWMANKGIELEQNEGKTVLFAFEEAIGFMCGTAVWDKDGVSAAMHTAEMVAYLDTQGLTLHDQLCKIYTDYGYHITNNSYYLNYNPEMTTKMFKRLRNFSGPNTYPKSFGRFKITGVRDLTSGFDSTRPGNKPTLPVSKSSEMITFYTENGATITIRTSGTEPKIKWYSELISEPGVPQEKWTHFKDELAELIRLMVAECYQPDENGFIARSD